MEDYEKFFNTPTRGLISEGLGLMVLSGEDPGPGDGGGGGTENYFDEPASTYIDKMVAGSTAGIGKLNCSLWSQKQGIIGETDATEWRSSAGSRAEVNLNVADDPADGISIVRFRMKVEQSPATKVWIGFYTLYMDPSPTAWFDITDDGTPAASRVGALSPEISEATCSEHPDHDGWIYVRFKLDMTGADVSGTNYFRMSDAPTGDMEMDRSGLTLIRAQDLTFELLA